MESIENLNKSIETKWKLIKFTEEQAENSLKTNNVLALRRQVNTLTTKVREVHEIKVKIQELKFENGEETKNIEEWNSKLENDLFKVEAHIAEIDNTLKRIDQKENEAKEEIEARIRQLRYEEELKVEQAKLEQKLKYEKKMDESRKSSEHGSATKTTKLPKLVISKFNGNFTDWTRFWEQYQAGIGVSDMQPSLKFSYLKELLETKVRALVEGLPLTGEGFERAKNILKTKYGKQSEIVNAHIKNIMTLEPVRGANSNKVSKFYEQLLTNVQALETIGRLGEVNGYVRMTLDKLESIRGDLARFDDDWQNWKFPNLIEALRKWTERNPPSQEDRTDSKPKVPSGKSFQAKGEEMHPRPCVYCKSTEHRSLNCDKITTPSQRKKHLSSNQLCFNCTGAKHKASECGCTSTCQVCHKKHHTSICEKKPEKMMVASGGSLVTFPVVVVEVNGVRCRALLNTGAISSYASAALLDRVNSRPLRKTVRQIEMMMTTTRTNVKVHKINVTRLSGGFRLETEVTKVNRSVLLALDNPWYPTLITQYAHLQGVTIDDTDTKPQLPVHLILGISEYTKIKTKTAPKVGNPREPVVELTKLGWTIMSPGNEANLSQKLLTQTSPTDYENLCRLDVLGLQDHPTGDQNSVY